MAFKVPEKHRIILPRDHPFWSDQEFGNNGWFSVPIHRKKSMHCIASDGGGWDHVSVTLKDRLPNYYEMKKIRRLFWGDDDIVVEFHMGKTNHVNINDKVLHLWCKQGDPIPTPPIIMV